MKTSVICTLIAGAAFAVGIGAGWILRGGRTKSAPSSPEKIAKWLAAASAPAGGKQAPADDREHSAEIVTTELEKMKSLSVNEFGIHMADAWLDYGHPDNHIRRALYLKACDAEKAMAFYREFKRRKGMTHKDDSGLREFFTIVAKRDGAGFMKQVTEASPEGVAELDSLMHGWAAEKPDEAVAWLNSLPEGTPYYTKALQGMIWGIAETSPATALQVYQQLDPADRDRGTAHNLANSTVMNFGLKGLTELLAGVSDESERQLFLSTSMEYGMREPPAEFVKWMAAPLETAPYLRRNFDQMASRWATGAPEAAVEWLGESGLREGAASALSIMAASLVRAGRGSEIEAWLSANPNAPGHAAVETGMREAGRLR